MSPENNPFSLKEAIAQMSSFIKAYQPSSSIERMEIKINPVDMLSWLSLQQDDVKIYGANQSDTVSIAGIGEAARVTARRPEPLPKVFKKLRTYLSPKYPYLQWYGGFCFDGSSTQDWDWNGFGAYRFVLPRFELAAQGDKMIFCCNLTGREDIGSILKQLSAIKVGELSASGRRKLFSISRRSDKPDQKRWQKNVDHVLAKHAVQKVVLARKTLLCFKQVPDPWVMLRQLKSVTPNSYHFGFQFKKTCFLGASPERLYRRYQRNIESEALAGTMPKSADVGSLLNSEKNNREHALVVEAIDETFKEICVKYAHDKQPGILTLANGHHLVTKFQGQLKDGVNDEDILQFLHPTPALGGTPRKAALEMIRKLEGFSRGWYGGPVGYVGLDWAEFVVGIRSGLARGKKLSVFAGAGIVQGSDASAEWAEVENKISNFIKIIR